LRAEITRDPWHLAFVDADRGLVLSEGDASSTGPSGSLGFRTADGWAHAQRVVSSRGRERGVETVLETTDPGMRRMVVRVTPAGSDVIAVEAQLEDGPDSAVGAFGIGWVLDPSDHLLGHGERSNAVDQRGTVLENWSAEGPFQPDERPVVPALVPPRRPRTPDDPTNFPLPA